MRKLILRWLGFSTATQLRDPEPVSRAQLSGFREDTQNLTTAVEFLAGKLNDTVTRDEVSQELNERLKRVEASHAGVLSGTKNQIRRTRNAAWLLWGFLLLVSCFATIQLHDWHIAECVLTRASSSAQDFVCTAAFPFADHEGAQIVRLGIRELSGEEDPQPIVYEHDVSPRAVGVLAYLAIFGGLGIGLQRYRTRVREEQGIEVGDFTEEDLDALSAAQNDDSETVHLFPGPSPRRRGL